MSDDADFTPDRSRSISIDGRLDEALLERLRPQIAELTAQSREPITVFIDSWGGSAAAGERILGLLRSTSHASESPCRINTVAAPTAGSAAADLLSAGDLALAYPQSTLLYHGTRWPLPEQRLTGDLAAKIGHALPTLDEIFAAKLAQNSLRRFRFIVSALRPMFEPHRAEADDPKLGDLDCLQTILRAKLSPAAQQVLERGIRLWRNYNGLLLQFEKRLRRGRTVTQTQLRKTMLHAAAGFEYETGQAEAWDGGLGKICGHFHFLNSFFDFGALCDYVAGRPGPKTAVTDIDADDFQQFRLLGLAICRALQEGENQITPMDAVWLGLIDSVRSPGGADENLEFFR